MNWLYSAALAGLALLPHPGLAAPVDAAGPTFADVLARPDDTALNLAYAHRLIREDHLNAAAATLERILLLRPDADDVRVTYMIVLYRLDDLAGARREADVLKTRQLAGALAADYARYSERIYALAKPTRFAAYLGSGVRVDTDVTYLTEDDGTRPKNGDVSYVSMAGLAVEHRPGSGPIDKVFAQFDLGSKMNAEHSDYNILTGRFEAGLEKRFGGLVARVSGFAAASLVDRELFSRDAGGRLRLGYEIDARLQVFADGEIAYTGYDDIDVAVNETEHDGARWRAGGGLVFQATDQHQFVLQSHAAGKDARSNAYAYDAADVEAKWLGTFTGGQYMSAGLRYAAVDYRGFDTDYGETRSDRVTRARVSYGLPVRTLGGWMGVDTSGGFFNFGDLVLQTSLDYVRQNSNISDFDYSNLGAEVLLTRRFQF
jgi:hypothetical protein